MTNSSARLLSPQERCKNYIDAIEGAVSGQGGDLLTYKVASTIFWGFNVPFGDGMRLFQDWNTRCTPPWSERDLTSKARSAINSQHPKPRGHLLGESQKFYHGRTSVCRPQKLTNGLPSERKPEKVSNGTLKPDRTGFKRGTPEQLARLARSRGIGLAGVRLADERGFPVFGHKFGFECWGLTDSSGRVLEIRRLDGEKFPEWRDLPERKSHAVGGSQKGWPVGVQEARSFPKVALVEGMPDFLEAHYLTLWESKPDVAPVAMLSCSPRISDDALPYFAGKRVRIFAHGERAGAKGAKNWAEQLISIGATVDAFDFNGLKKRDGSPCNDLLDYSHLDPQEHINGAPFSILP